MRAVLLASTMLAVASPAWAANSVTDCQGHAWSITPTGSIMEGSQYTPGGGGTASLAINGCTVYGLDAHGKGWFTLSGNGHYWITSAAPAATLPTITPALTATAQTTMPSIAAAAALPASAIPAAAAPATTTASAAPTVSKNSASNDAGNQDTPAAPTAEQVCASMPATQTLLPCGMFHVTKSQVLSQDNVPVRLNCTAWWGDMPNYDAQMLTIVLSGFNCLRTSFVNAQLDDYLGKIDQVVTAAAKVGVRIIIDNHANEGGGDCASQQKNGLWYDKGGASNGTDGCGATGTVDDAKWVSDWAKVAQHYAKNPTVIGYDLKNEPTGYGTGSCWGCGDIGHDIRLAYQRAGNAILTVDPDKLIIAEGVQDYSAGAPEGDLRPVAAQPVVLTVPGRVIYSVHEYPATIGGAPNNDGPAYIAQMNAVWGYLITQDIAPVWIGEAGASMNGNPTEAAWAATITGYVNGKAQGGLVVPAGGQPPGTDWWMWSSLPGGLPDGALQSDMTTPKPEQSAVYQNFVQQPGSTPLPAGTTTAAYGQQLSILSAQARPTNQTAPAATPSAPASTDPAPVSTDTAQLPPPPTTSDPATLQAWIAQATATLNPTKATAP